ncbi:MAG: VOC family protein [Actinomycetota bacterium]|nr:hypothetical protein [Actinomycetota bacterium]
MSPGEWSFESIDFIYTPSKDVAADAAYFVDVLHARRIFAVEGMGARAALLALTPGPPHVLLTDHLKGDRPVLVYRVANLARAMDGLQARGWQRDQVFDIPHGPCCSFRTPGGHRIAIYELVRPEAGRHFEGRFDF